MTDLQSYFIPPAGIHPSVYKHNYDLDACSGTLGEGVKGVKGLNHLSDGGLYTPWESTIISGVLL